MADDLTPDLSSTSKTPTDIVGEGLMNVVPAPALAPNEPNTTAQHAAMGAVLADVIKEGKETMPAEAPPLVCKPRQLESWRMFKIMSEFVEGFQLISRYGLAVSFFGSARCSFEDSVYKAAHDLAGRLAQKGFAVITGGASGVMQAANEGAYDVGGASVGLNIRLEQRQDMNRFLTDSMVFDHFFVRKVMLTYASEVYVYFPGGFGTLDEFFEIITLVQTKKIRKVPIVLYDKEYWTPLIAFFKTKLYGEHRAIDEPDMELYHLVDTVDEAYDYIIKNVTC